MKFLSTLIFNICYLFSFSCSINKTTEIQFMPNYGLKNLTFGLKTNDMFMHLGHNALVMPSESGISYFYTNLGVIVDTAITSHIISFRFTRNYTGLIDFAHVMNGSPEYISSVFGTNYSIQNLGSNWSAMSYPDLNMGFTLFNNKVWEVQAIATFKD